MSSGIQLIVGLGNPGAEYEKTRHNAGAWFVSEVANSANVTLRHDNKYHGLHAVANLDGQECHLLIPTTYMNHSGQSVQSLANFYKISPRAILIAHDEIDMPAGIVRLKVNGGHGGHNGLRDVISHLNSKAFYRLRIGVDRPEDSRHVVDYVLAPPRKIERNAIDGALQAAVNVLPLMIAGEFQKAMQLLHTT